MNELILCFLFSLLLNSFFWVMFNFVPARRKIKVKNLSKRDEPFYVATDGSVCADCYASHFVNIGVGERATIPLGFALELPEMTEAVIRPRSGMSKKGIDVQIGTIDTDYRGEVSCTVVNNTKSELLIGEGTRICQIAFRDVPALSISKVKVLSETKRGTGGFGSTGIN